MIFYECPSAGVLFTPLVFNRNATVVTIHIIIIIITTGQDDVSSSPL